MSAVARILWDDVGTSQLWRAVGFTMRRAITGFLVSLLIGGALGLTVARSRVLRTALGSLITGLQTMPSITWFPWRSCCSGSVSGRSCSWSSSARRRRSANGIIAGVDSVPPVLRRVSLTLGARGPALYRDVIVPAAMPDPSCPV